MVGYQRPQQVFPVINVKDKPDPHWQPSSATAETLNRSQAMCHDACTHARLYGHVKTQAKCHQKQTASRVVFDMYSWYDSEYGIEASNDLAILLQNDNYYYY